MSWKRVVLGVAGGFSTLVIMTGGMVFKSYGFNDCRGAIGLVALVEGVLFFIICVLPVLGENPKWSEIKATALIYLVLLVGLVFGLGLMYIGLVLVLTNRLVPVLCISGGVIIVLGFFIALFSGTFLTSAILCLTEEHSSIKDKGIGKQGV